MLSNRMFVVALVCLSFVAFANAQCTEYKDVATCNDATENGAPCHWCYCKALPSACYNDSDAKYLPASIFNCTNLQALKDQLKEAGLVDVVPSMSAADLKTYFHVHQVEMNFAPAPAAVGTIDPALVWQIGKEAWQIIEDNAPVANETVDWGGAVPTNVTDWTQLSGWVERTSQAYTFKFKNFVGMLLTEVDWVFQWKSNGVFGGTGQYVTGAGPLIKKNYAYLTEHVTVTAKANNPVNYGSSSSPIGGLDLVISMKSWGYFETTTVSCHVVVRGDGNMQVTACDQNTADV